MAHTVAARIAAGLLVLGALSAIQDIASGSSAFVPGPAVSSSPAAGLPVLRSSSSPAAALATSAALSLAAEPALASEYDNRQGEASLVLVGTIILFVGITAASIFIGTQQFGK
mmetsp:Transcript_115718/g.300039  ORF Transcript_115718/g.300039 Transcript_115718/m.300039 type:complete len:113 (-) Transcript_115718:230-568(-)